MNDSPAVATRALSKSYRVGHLRGRRRPALIDLTVEVQRGEIFGYLGPNGSGKTTTLKLLMGLVRRDSGTASVLGVPVEQRGWRQSVGYLPENPYLYDYLTAREYLDYVGRLFGMRRPERKKRAADLLETVGLSRAADSPMRRYSKGMLQRVGLAQALVNEPALVFLDEPMSGLDPIGRRLVRDLILELKSQGRTVFFSTHILPDAEALCDRVALLRGGRLAQVGRLDEILQIGVDHLEVLVSGLGEDALDALPRGVRGRKRLGERWRLDVDEGALGAVVQAVEAARGRILSVSPERQSLEDYFFKELTAEERQAWAAAE